MQWRVEMRLPLIDGREVIPVRLIPFITSFQIGPQRVVKLLAHKEGLAWPKLRDEDKFSAYHLPDQGTPARVLPVEWDRVLDDQKVLEAKIRTGESFEDEKYYDWRRATIEGLPAGVFVWRDEFEAAFLSAHSRECLSIIGTERVGSRELNFQPMIEAEFRPIVIEGFEALLTPAVANPASPKPRKTHPLFRNISVTYSDFCYLCHVEDPQDWDPLLSLAIDGIYVRVPDQRLLPREEFRELVKHPTGDLTKPALVFPCTLENMEQFLDFYGIYGCIDPFEMAAFIVESKEGLVDAGGEGKPKKSLKVEQSLLKMVYAMAVGGYRYDPDATRSTVPGDVAEDADSAGVSLDVDTVRRWLREAADLRERKVSD